MADPELYSLINSYITTTRFLAFAIRAIALPVRDQKKPYRELLRLANDARQEQFRARAKLQAYVAVYLPNEDFSFLDSRVDDTVRKALNFIKVS